MNSQLIKRWNQTVANEDTVWVLGDFALGRIDATIPLAAALNGHKILLAGNHDRCWIGRGDGADDWTQRYLDGGFDEIVQGVQTLSVDGTSVHLCHFPYFGDSRDDDRFPEHRPIDHGGWLLHGHVHERWRQCGRMINVGVDVNDYRPISEREIAELIARGPARQ